jgi:hypothetical protein
LWDEQEEHFDPPAAEAAPPPFPPDLIANEDMRLRIARLRQCGHAPPEVVPMAHSTSATLPHF